MEPFISIEDHYANALLSCHHGGPLDHFIDDSSGYARDDSDPASLQAPHPNIYEDIA